MTEPKMMKVKGDGIKIQLAVWEGKGKQILCIHGLTANSRFWDCLASALAPRHRIIAMDLRGRGLSDKPSSGYSVERHCKDVLAIMNDLGLEQPVLMGHSLGHSFSCLRRTTPQRVDKLILVDGGGKLSEEQMAKVFVGIKPSWIVWERSSLPLTIISRKWSWPVFGALELLYGNLFPLWGWKVKGGLRSRVHPKHIEEEAENLGKVDSRQFYKK